MTGCYRLFSLQNGDPGRSVLSHRGLRFLKAGWHRGRGGDFMSFRWLCLKTIFLSFRLR